ncbi:hypothetical protein [Erythrobacter sp. Alg231-14]|uniref:hypothetical protein n=1 Tax=Erythrobacter sp. Alg231-14 TaxID=1922225 RepID=UPI000D558CE5
MTITKRTAIGWWVGGLIAFAITIGFHIPLVTDGVPGGMTEHQMAPDAATVDAIQQSWRADGLNNSAMIAMITDLIFIGIYGVGCVLAGIYYGRPTSGSGSIILRILGWAAFASGIVFLITDYGETIAQFAQLMNGAGDDGLANFASTLRPIKMFTWATGFLTVLAALIADRFLSRAA